MSYSEVKSGLERGIVVLLKLEVRFPDGQTQTFELDASSGVGGVLFNDGLIKDLVETRALLGDADYSEGIAAWNSEGAEWHARPSFLIMPAVDPARCGAGNCPAAKDGQCVGAGQCAR